MAFSFVIRDSDQSFILHGVVAVASRQEIHWCSFAGMGKGILVEWVCTLEVDSHRIFGSETLVLLLLLSG